MKNPLALLLTAARTWIALRRRWPGLFSLRDAARQFHRVLLPARFTYRAAARALARHARIEPEGDAWRVTLPGHGGLVFYWPSAPDPNLWFLIEQELTPRNPHFYTTAPVRLDGGSRVLDVGACEGLFAFRCLRQGLAGEVVAFEPAPVMQTLLRRGAAANGVAERLRLEPRAVGARCGTVRFDTAPGAEAGRIDANAAGGAEVPCTTLDEYCRERSLGLTARDLIKVDAEGADLDVLHGAAGLIRDAAPQLAVTTYHCDAHAAEMVDWLRRTQPRYRMRLKGFAFWTPRPRPLLLQASTLP
jgi:FkbM family methyltransferase